MKKPPTVVYEAKRTPSPGRIRVVVGGPSMVAVETSNLLDAMGKESWRPATDYERQTALVDAVIKLSEQIEQHNLTLGEDNATEVLP